MLSLETMNLVTRRQGNGTYVMGSSEEVLSPLFQENDDIIDVLTLRKIIEPQIAALASKNATTRQIDMLAKIIAEQENNVSEGRNPIKADCDFHYTLARMSKNRRPATPPRCSRATFEKSPGRIPSNGREETQIHRRTPQDPGGHRKRECDGGQECHAASFGRH